MCFPFWRQNVADLSNCPGRQLDTIKFGVGLRKASQQLAEQSGQPREKKIALQKWEEGSAATQPSPTGTPRLQSQVELVFLQCHSDRRAKIKFEWESWIVTAFPGSCSTSPTNRETLHISHSIFIFKRQSFHFKCFALILEYYIAGSRQKSNFEIFIKRKYQFHLVSV